MAELGLAESTVKSLHDDEEEDFMLPIILFDAGDAALWRMVDNFIPYVMNVRDHNVRHGFCCRCVKDLHDIVVAVRDDRSLGRPCSYSSYACW